MAMLIPEAWAGNPHIKPEKNAFYEYHASLMEPWDGPAAIAFTDGRMIGATLDRNGLRPGRYVVTHDDLVVLASEAGVLDIDPKNIKTKGRLQPGKMFLVDTVAGRIISDKETKQRLSARQPYQQWLQEKQITLDQLPEPSRMHSSDHGTILCRQRAFGYTDEDLRMILEPMAANGQEPIGSMGTDTPLACLSDRPQPLFNYFKQLFAQVTNPPIDPIREEMVMSLISFIGTERNILEETADNCHTLKLPHPILTNRDLEKLRRIATGDLLAITLPALFRAADGEAGLRRAIDELCRQASLAVKSGYTLLILSDRGVDKDYAPIPSLLALAAVHNLLVREETRTQVALIIESGEPREVMHFALLIGYGASAINPYLAIETLEDLAGRGYLPDGIGGEMAAAKFIKGINKGLLKTFSKMGISTLQSYRGAQVFEAIGLNKDLVDAYFAGTTSRVEGVGLDVLAREAQMKHEYAYQPITEFDTELAVGGSYHFRLNGEYHLLNPDSISKLQHSVRNGNFQTFQEYTELIDTQSRNLATLRSLMEIKKAKKPVPLDQVEPAKEIVKRFATGAMSFGSISKEAHETLAIAMNRIGGKSNTGEGGEDEARYTRDANGDSRRSAVKQVASARFGVTANYLINADELQIKMAQGAKPGEGGQLPGHKVDDVIARIRHSIPGVGLISPPPHHDIYSIEDLAQLIFDLKNVNPQARIAVKLVAEVGVRHSGRRGRQGPCRRGAHQRRHRRHRGFSAKFHQARRRSLGAWPRGNPAGSLAERSAQPHSRADRWQAANRARRGHRGLVGRGRIRFRHHAAHRHGLHHAAQVPPEYLLGRHCDARSRTAQEVSGEPEHVINFFFFVAEQVRQYMAELGFRKVDEMVGRVDKLDVQPAVDHWKARGIDLSAILYNPPMPGRVARHCVQAQDHGLGSVMDHQLIKQSQPALETRTPVEIELPIRNVDRTVGAMLSGEIARRYGSEGLPDDTIRVRFKGSAGQSFGAFLAKGVTLSLEGDANDYVGKGLSGGRVVVYAPREAGFVAEENMIVGNVVLYGATSGEAFFNGVAGERFAVRNSGATAVVEGVGDHGCEYMTKGLVVVLGPCGSNFAAGMSGGVAYVLDERREFTNERCNQVSVDLEPVIEPEDVRIIRDLVTRHYELTGSARAKMILDNWTDMLPQFIKVFPHEFKRVLNVSRSRYHYIPGQPLPVVAELEEVTHG